MDDSPRIEDLNAAESEWVASLLETARQLGAGPDLASLSQRFEDARDDWYEADLADRGDPNPVIMAFGVAVGQQLVDAAGLQWAVVTDEHGTEIGVVGQPGDIVVMPANAVTKRWTGEASGTLADLVTGLVDRIAEIRAAAD